MSRSVAVVGLLAGLVSVAGATPLTMTVLPNSPKGCQVGVVILGSVPVNCPTIPLLLNVLTPNLGINYGVPLSSYKDLGRLDSIEVDVSVADNPGLFSNHDAASEGGTVYLVIGGKSYSLGTFGGGSNGLNGNPIASPLALEEKVPANELVKIFSALESTGFVFAVEVSRTSGDFEVLDPAGVNVTITGDAPEPDTFAIVGLGLIGLGWLLRRKRR